LVGVIYKVAITKDYHKTCLKLFSNTSNYYKVFFNSSQILSYNKSFEIINNKSNQKIRVMTFNILTSFEYSRHPESYGYENEVTEINIKQRINNIIKTIQYYSPDILLLQEANAYSEPDKKYHNFPNDIQLNNGDIIGCHSPIIGFKEGEINGKWQIQTDAAMTLLNTDIFQIIKVQTGSFKSGTSYNIIYTKDKRHDNFIFIINIHVKIFTRDEKIQNLILVAEELIKYFNNFISENNIKITLKDKLIIGGDFNANSTLFHENRIDRNIVQNYDNNDWLINYPITDDFYVFMNLLNKSDNILFKNIIEYGNKIPTTISCADNKASEIDHIISSGFESYYDINNRLTFDIIRSSCKQIDLQKIKSEIKEFLKKKQKPRDFLEKLIKYINQYKNIKINNNLKDNNINNSDHLPKIIDLFYVRSEYIQSDTKTIINGYYPAQIKTNKIITLILPSVLDINDMIIFYDKLCEIHKETNTLIFIIEIQDILKQLVEFNSNYNNIILIINKNFTTQQMKIIPDRETQLPMIDSDEFKTSHIQGLNKKIFDEYNIREIISSKNNPFNKILKGLNKYCNIYIVNISISSVNYYNKNSIININQDKSIYNQNIIWNYILKYLYINRKYTLDISNIITSSYYMEFNKLLSLNSTNLLNYVDYINVNYDDNDDLIDYNLKCIIENININKELEYNVKKKKLLDIPKIQQVIDYINKLPQSDIDKKIIDIECHQTYDVESLCKLFLKNYNQIQQQQKGGKYNNYYKYLKYKKLYLKLKNYIYYSTL
jgi:hypothetical protein